MKTGFSNSKYFITIVSKYIRQILFLFYRTGNDKSDAAECQCFKYTGDLISIGRMGIGNGPGNMEYNKPEEEHGP